MLTSGHALTTMLGALLATMAAGSAVIAGARHQREPQRPAWCALTSAAAWPVLLTGGTLLFLGERVADLPAAGNEIEALIGVMRFASNATTAIAVVAICTGIVIARALLRRTSPPRVATRCVIVLLFAAGLAAFISTRPLARDARLVRHADSAEELSRAPRQCGQSKISLHICTTASSIGGIVTAGGSR